MSPLWALVLFSTISPVLSRAFDLSSCSAALRLLQAHRGKVYPAESNPVRQCPSIHSSLFTVLFCDWLPSVAPGKCICGEITIEASGDPMFTAFCHCKFFFRVYLLSSILAVPSNEHLTQAWLLTTDWQVKVRVGEANLTTWQLDRKTHRMSSVGTVVIHIFLEEQMSLTRFRVLVLLQS